jgi:hypothetical protein
MCWFVIVCVGYVLLSAALFYYMLVCFIFAQFCHIMCWFVNLRTGLPHLTLVSHTMRLLVFHILRWFVIDCAGLFFITSWFV